MDYTKRFYELLQWDGIESSNPKDSDCSNRYSVSIDSLNKVKKSALDKLYKTLKSHMEECSKESCPLMTFSSSKINLNSEEQKEVSSIIKRLDCPIDLLLECKILGINIPCSKCNSGTCVLKSVTKNNH